MWSPLRNRVMLGLLLAGLCLAAFWPALTAGFVNFDDPIYVTENPNIQQGWTLELFGWAFRTGYASNWHPLTWLSHALDVQLYGLRPLGHHLTNLALHTANSVLVFVLFIVLTGTTWRSFLVAGLFALHPLHVESVAWVAERKDVLNTFFALLSLIAYARYATRSKQGVPGNARTDYLTAFIFFALALLSKPMAVTLPCVMLLLDYWPLQRLRLGASQTGDALTRRPRQLLLEKIPFFALAATVSLVTVLVQRAGGATYLNAQMSLTARIENAAVSYARYLLLTLWPANLTVFYEHPLGWPMDVVAGAILLLGVISGVVLWLSRRRPYLLTGWCWFLGTLVPVIGLVQVGEQAIADRYMYLPSIGLFVAFAWGVAEIALLNHWRRNIAATVSAVLLLTLGAVTNRQCRYWQSTETLFGHALELNENNALAHNNLGTALSDAGRFSDAEQHYLAALRIRPGYIDAQLNYAILLSRERHLDKAATRFADFLKENPGDANAHFNLGSILLQQGDVPGAVEHYEAALRLNPAYPEALNDLAWIRAANPRAEFRNGAEAVRLATRACELSGYRKPIFLGTLAAALAENGRFPDAIATAEKACALAQSQSQTNLLERNQKLLEGYRKGIPGRDEN